VAVHAVSDKVTGPYVDKGICWPDNQGGKGHNVTALVMPDGRFAIVVSETRPGDVFVSKSLDGPWEQEKGNDHHGSKIIVIPFDGAALDRDLRNAAAATPPAAFPAQGR
jgi:hypothetical protein